MGEQSFSTLKRNKFQRWLWVASGVFLLIAFIAFAVDRGNAETRDYSSTPTSELIKQANGYYAGGRFEDAIPYLEEAAKRGDAKAQYSLGYMYEHGEGVKKNIDGAIKYYQLAAKQGHKNAQTALKNIGN